jgi:hypothetical protein
MRYETLATDLAERLRLLRHDLYGAHGAPLLAQQLGVAAYEWLAFEAGETPPAEVLERLVATTLVDPIWLLKGVGPRYRKGPPLRWATDAAPDETPSDLVPGYVPRPEVVSTLVGRHVRVPAWEELSDVQDIPPLGIIGEVFDLGHGPLARVQGDGFNLRCIFELDELELLD